MQQISLNLNPEQIKFLEGHRTGNIQENIELLIDNAMSKQSYDKYGTVRQFLNNKIEVTNNEYEKLYMSEIYLEYYKYLDNEMLVKPLGKIKFSRLVKGYGIEVRTDTKSETCLFNVRYKRLI